jgi:hypothetical protein
MGDAVQENGYAALTPGWPDDPETVEEAKAHPEVFAGKSIGQVADHFETIIRGLNRKPAVIGHSFGGLLTKSPPDAAWPPYRSRSIRHRSAACCRYRSPR